MEERPPGLGLPGQSHQEIGNGLSLTFSQHFILGESVDGVESSIEDAGVVLRFRVEARVGNQQRKDRIADVAVEGQGHIRFAAVRLLQDGSGAQVGQEGLLQQPEEELDVFDTVDAFEEEYDALLVARNQTGWHVGFGAFSVGRVVALKCEFQAEDTFEILERNQRAQDGSRPQRFVLALFNSN